MYLSIPLGMVLQITEKSLIQKMPSHKDSGLNFPYQHLSQTVQLLCC